MPLHATQIKSLLIVLDLSTLRHIGHCPLILTCTLRVFTFHAGCIPPETVSLKRRMFYPPSRGTARSFCGNMCTLLLSKLPAQARHMRGTTQVQTNTTLSHATFANVFSVVHEWSSCHCLQPVGSNDAIDSFRVDHNAPSHRPGLLFAHEVTTAVDDVCFCALSLRRRPTLCKTTKSTLAVN